MNASTAFDLETQSLLRDGITRFSRAHRARVAWPPRLKDGAEDAPDSWAHVARNGWLALGLPDAVGGSGAAIGDLFALMRAAGEGLWSAPLIEGAGLAGGALLALAPGQPRDDMLRRIIEGEAIVGMAGVLSDPATASVRARKTSAGVMLTGHSGVAVGGHAWDEILVPVITDIPQGAGLAVVHRSAPGLACKDVETLDGRRAVVFVFNDVAADVFEAGEASLLAAWRRGSLLAAAEAAGIACAALDATKAYLALRRQFGRPIIQFQAVQHRLVEMHIRLCEVDAMLETVSKAYDTNAPTLPRLVLQLRAQCSKNAVWITQQAIQLHGGMGMTQDLPIGAYYKRVLFIDSLFGGYEDAIDQLCAMSDIPHEQES